ncbi:hypothetical protein E2C01_070759 [Portunus trituberculatus]|uniref:Alpha-carbonic anhydrase domain-containing protein n=1 Tax=Portunus trituberculatus TaxID=210409 RepID=A0A5B7I359_PORTR|nr:hypothetical protein [Portunus trituberculatus]
MFPTKTFSLKVPKLANLGEGTGDDKGEGIVIVIYQTIFNTIKNVVKESSPPETLRTIGNTAQHKATLAATITLFTEIFPVILMISHRSSNAHYLTYCSSTLTPPRTTGPTKWPAMRDGPKLELKKSQLEKY